MLRKLPAALLLVALLIAIPGLMRSLSPDSSAEPAPLLTPGAAGTGVRDSADRVAFWQSRIETDSDYLNRIQAGAAMLELARQSSDPDDYERALDYADAALRANPSSLDARILRGAVLSSAHRFGEALTEAEAVLAADPDSFQAHAVAGDSFLELQEYEAASRHLDTLAALAPSTPAVLARQAEFAWDTGDEVSALSFGEQALARANEAGLAPGQLSFYAIRTARFRLDTGDVPGAAELSEAAVEIAPHVPAVHSTRGYVRWAQGDIEGAIDSFETATSITPLREALLALIGLYGVTGNADAVAATELRLFDLGPPLVVTR